MKLIVTIPALNEEATIARVVRGIPTRIDGVDEIDVLVLNDGSTDRTAEEAEEAGAEVVNLLGGGGLGLVFRTGLERAMRRGADLIVNIDGDGQFDPRDIPKLVRPLLDDEADFVTCSRFADPALRPEMPPLKYQGNRIVTRIINWVCGGTRFTDVSCGFRAFNREAAYRLTLFGRFTYTQETFIDLVSKGVRMVEVPLRVRGVREHGQSRVCRSTFRYALNSLPIILRAMRDIQPLKFFGGISLGLGGLGMIGCVFLASWYLNYGRTAPFQSLIPVTGVLVTLGVLMGGVALLADMMGRHRRISEELLYLARRRAYATRRPPRPAAAPVTAGSNGTGKTLHDSWTLPVHRSVPRKPERVER